MFWQLARKIANEPSVCFCFGMARYWRDGCETWKQFCIAWRSGAAGNGGVTICDLFAWGSFKHLGGRSDRDKSGSGLCGWRCVQLHQATEKVVGKGTLYRLNSWSIGTVRMTQNKGNAWEKEEKERIHCIFFFGICWKRCFFLSDSTRFQICLWFYMDSRSSRMAWPGKSGGILLEISRFLLKIWSLFNLFLMRMCFLVWVSV